MALTVGEHMYKSLLPKSKEVHMNVTDMEVLHAQVAQRDKNSAQLLMLEADIDLTVCAVQIKWYNVSADGSRSENAFASSTVRFEEPAVWLSEWERVEHLIKGRIDTLTQMAAEGTANRLSKNMTYNLFENVVNYTDKYRGMTSVVLHEHEAFADVSLVPERHGTWHTPPHWIDSVFHLAGFIMNGSDASNTKDFFYVTPGWASSRMIKPLEADAPYRSYVRMFPTKEANMYAGDVYVLQHETIVGMMGQIKFRRIPRLLMNQFFSPPDSKKPVAGVNGNSKLRAPPHDASTFNPNAAAQASIASTKQPIDIVPTASHFSQELKSQISAETKAPTATVGQEDSSSTSVIDDCLRLIAREAGLEPDQLTDDASFVELGVDSLMSLVLSEKFRTELQLEVKSSLFLEYTRIGELRGWLEQYC
jgi:iterative type I PKS product template protein